MKKVILLSVLLIAVANTYSQDTTSYITSSCLQFAQQPSILPVGDTLPIHFGYKNDSLRISGMIRANCAGDHIAIINKTADTVFITTLDTGILATCNCVYTFEIKFKVSPNDTIIKFNSDVYNLKNILSYIVLIDDQEDQITFYPNPTSSLIKFKTQSGTLIRKISIINETGQLVKTISNKDATVDMTEFSPGIYLMEFEFADHRRDIKKVIKK